MHGCARVAHCVTVRWRNFSHYCCPLRQYDVWVTCSEHREALAGEPTAHDVHKQEFTVQGGSTQFASEQVGRLRCVTAVDGGIEAFPFSIVICAPMVYIVPSVKTVGSWIGCKKLSRVRTVCPFICPYSGPEFESYVPNELIVRNVGSFAVFLVFCNLPIFLPSTHSTFQSLPLHVI